MKLSYPLLLVMKAHIRRNHLLEQLDQLHIRTLETVYDPNNTKILLRLHHQWKNDQNGSVSTIKPAANTVLIGQGAATLLYRESTLESPRRLTL